MRKRLWIGLALTAVVAALVGAGCGDDDGTNADASGSASDESTVTRAAFVARGDAICAAGREEIASQAQAILSAKGDRKELETTLVSTALVPVLEEEIDDLRELEVPSGDEEEIEAILAGFEDVVDEAKENPAVFLGSATALPSDPWRKADKRAEEYGFKECPRS